MRDHPRPTRGRPHPRAWTLGLVALLLLPGAVMAQSDDPGPRRLTVLAGAGNAMGWFGLQGETYFASEQISLFAGLGYVADDADAVEGAAGALGIRLFTPGARHRGFLELSASQVATFRRGGFGPPIEESRHYGPGLQAGYQYVSNGGFSLLVSGGLGYATGVPEGADNVHGLAGLGFGYTWR